MIRVAQVLFAAVVCGAAAGRSYAQALPPGVAECRAEIERQRYPAAESKPSAPLRLGELCPEIVDALDASAWGKALADGTAESLTPAAFIALADLVERYAAAPVRPAISTAALDAAVAETETHVEPPPLSLWDRAMQWLQERFGGAEPASAGWLEKWLGGLSVPERVTRYVVVALALLLTGATVAIVLNELRVLGAFGRAALRHVPAEPFDPSRDRMRARARNLADVRRAAAQLQPALLLRLIVDRLRRRAPLRDSLTHRELVRASDAALSGAQLESLRGIATAAERVTYADWRPGSSDVEAVLADGESLLDSLEAETEKRE